MATDLLEPRRPPDGPLEPPGDYGGLHNVFRERYLLRLLVKKELQARYQGSFLGLIWSYIQPLVRFLAYYLVIGYVLGLNRGVQNFALHIFAAMVMVHYFTETFSAGTRSIVRNKGLIQKLSMPREMFPVASMLVSAYHTLPQLVILFVAVFITGWDPTLADVAAGLLGFAIMATFGMALALLFSAANVFFRDFSNIVTTIGIFVTWSAPMIYPFDRIRKLAQGHEWVETLYLTNPIANGVLLFQQLFWIPTTDPTPADPTQDPIPLMPDYLLTRGLIVLAACLVILAFSQWVFSRLEGKFAERL
jgi:ABC-2 type transport system permease protein